jgi:hypothetical protein
MRAKPGRNRWAFATRRRAARRAEAYIGDYRFPSHICGRVSRRLDLDDDGWRLVEQGLREWFICCAWRSGAVLGMPSRAVDEAWHEFILDSPSYIRFCDHAFGQYLHHTPDEAMSTPMPDALADTVRAWDRSHKGSEEESVLWDIDARLEVGEPLGVSGLQLSAARSRIPYAGGWAGGGELGAAGAGHHHHGQGGCGAGGGCNSGNSCGGGGGCGGGGCGGGS